MSPPPYSDLYIVAKVSPTELSRVHSISALIALLHWREGDAILQCVVP